MMKVALFGFNGDAMCFVHVMLNAFDLKERGHEVTVIIEGSATKLVETFHRDPKAPFSNLYQRLREEGLIGGVCRACAAKMGSLASAEEQGLALLGDMSGHPSIGRYLDEGYQVLTF
jgi:hypothetical protein